MNLDPDLSVIHVYYYTALYDYIKHILETLAKFKNLKSLRPLGEDQGVGNLHKTRILKGPHIYQFTFSLKSGHDTMKIHGTGLDEDCLIHLS